MLERAAKLVPALRPEHIETCARKVEDADEETFYLYSANFDRWGLGFIEVQGDLLRVTVNSPSEEIPYVVDRVEDKSELNTSRDVVPASKKTKANKKPGQQRSPGTKDSSVTAYIWQNQTSLRTQKGDTGSVVWRSSLMLASTLLRQRDTPLLTEDGEILPQLLDWGKGSLKVYELGSGTGVLPSLLFASPNFDQQGGVWLATDQQAMMDLLRKNLRQFEHKQMQSNIIAQELDWVEVSKTVKDAHRHPSRLQRLVREIYGGIDRKSGQGNGASVAYADLVVAIDCIFNPSLFTPLLDTLGLLCQSEQTVALVLVELREQEMMREFIAAWLDHSMDERKWDIWSLERKALGKEGLGQGYACFIGCLGSNTEKGIA